MAPGLIILAAVLAYRNSLSAPFLMDDGWATQDDPRIRSLSPPWSPLLQTTRPVVTLSFALNYAFGGLRVEGYHLVNLAAHVLAALALYGVVRRTARIVGPRGRAGEVRAGGLGRSARGRTGWRAPQRSCGWSIR